MQHRQYTWLFSIWFIFSYSHNTSYMQFETPAAEMALYAGVNSIELAVGTKIFTNTIDDPQWLIDTFDQHRLKKIMNRPKEITCDELKENFSKMKNFLWHSCARHSCFYTITAVLYATSQTLTNFAIHHSLHRPQVINTMNALYTNNLFQRLFIKPLEQRFNLVPHLAQETERDKKPIDTWSAVALKTVVFLPLFFGLNYAACVASKHTNMINIFFKLPFLKGNTFFKPYCGTLYRVPTSVALLGVNNIFPNLANSVDTMFTLSCCAGILASIGVCRDFNTDATPAVAALILAGSSITQYGTAQLITYLLDIKASHIQPKTTENLSPNQKRWWYLENYFVKNGIPTLFFVVLFCILPWAGVHYCQPDLVTP